MIFDPVQHKERAGLLLVGSTLYSAWASHCDIRPYTGWIMGLQLEHAQAGDCAQRDSAWE